MNPAAVRSAAARIAGRVHRTPVRTSATLDGRTGAQVLVKDEAVQKTGSFKARGALNRLLTLPEEAREPGLVCVTAGNHGAAVAWAAAQVGAKATVVMPTYSPAAKVAACWSYGAEVVLHGDSTGRRSPSASGCGASAASPSCTRSTTPRSSPARAPPAWSWSRTLDRSTSGW
ncbi:MAG TPA: pyridoxal-phosphate dependent enzyme [Actinomycetes bacterium]|nr:pyridoxal-phosphate dependent enzyme [Actinomycetes bacterium]